LWSWEATAVTTTDVNYLGDMLSVGSNQIHLEYPIEDAFELGDKIIVLFKPDARSGPFGQFHNLIAVSRSGERLWEAELPTTMSGDGYYLIGPKNPLTASTITSFACVINEENGRIIKKTFYK
jgi:hypothetical protein